MGIFAKTIEHLPWAVLVFYLLGAIPGTVSHDTRIKQAMAEVLLEQHKPLERLLRVICYRLPDAGKYPCD